ncbi:hypothetical protein [Wenjunlia tyrosinilytica]|uniref:Uncharacterized protein n=1 Tax=Wenjunlia tyrosinilytica TaxID=1544741 RepID=A0A917ZH40_9ACTN|nr:hypothetical protein [Wenjunlia tyrosinilytica]GGO83270.1 hypothetical protein GCM10012280_11860 [Wenjunlia tyrosinilytica]
MTETLALVESPVQLLNLLEWAHSRRGITAAAAEGAAGPAGVIPAPRRPGGEQAPAGPPLDIAVLPPKDTVGHGQLKLMAALAKSEGHHVRWYEARTSRAALARSAALLAPRVATARRLVLGDPFSRLVQAILPLARSAREVTVVDDGTATMEFVSLLSEGRPLVRWHRSGGAALGAAQASRRLTPSARRRIELFSSMPVTPPPGVHFSVNRFEWIRANYGPPRITGGVDLVGTSLVETGVVDEERYLTGVAELARSQRATRYLAHRREKDTKLAGLAGLTGLEIVRPELPLEIEARRGPIGSTIVSFPSTVVHTLPVVLAGTGINVVACDVDPRWLTGTASQRAQGFLRNVTSTARDLHRVASVPVPVAQL